MAYRAKAGRGTSRRRHPTEGGGQRRGHVHRQPSQRAARPDGDQELR